MTAYAVTNSGQAINESNYLNNDRTIKVLGALPGEVVNPSIPDNGTDVSVEPYLNWDDVEGVVTYDLYIWKDGEEKPDTPTCADLTASEYLILLGLLPETVYH